MADMAASANGTDREYHDYRAMLTELQQNPNEDRVVWRRELSDFTRRQASAVAMGLAGWIRSPHRMETKDPRRGGPILCRKEGCEPRCAGDGMAASRADVKANEAVVIARWDDHRDWGAAG